MSRRAEGIFLYVSRVVPARRSTAPAQALVRAFPYPAFNKEKEVSNPESILDNLQGGTACCDTFFMRNTAHYASVSERQDELGMWSNCLASRPKLTLLVQVQVQSCALDQQKGLDMFDGFIVSTFSCLKASCRAYANCFRGQQWVRGILHTVHSTCLYLKTGWGIL